MAKKSQHAEFLLFWYSTTVIQSLRRADYGDASLKFAIFRHFVPISKPQTHSNFSKTHLIGVDLRERSEIIRGGEGCKF